VRSPGSPSDKPPPTLPTLDERGDTVPEAPLPDAVQHAGLAALAGVAVAGAVAAAPIAGSQPRRAARLPAGTLVDQKYVVERVLGEGGMGVVYLARDVHTGLNVVLKAVRQELSHRRDVRARTLAEGRALAQIDHPNVVHLNAIVADGDGLWLVMQYIEGEGLDRLIARHADEGRPLPLDQALAIFRQIAAGIAAAHREGVIHRDLKPANVMLRSKDGVAKVTDFGIAKQEADAIAGRGMTRGIIGSLYYMSPEQVAGRRDLDKRVDVYALGILLYEMLVGHVPFDAESDVEIMRQHMQAPLPRVGAARPDVPHEIDAILQKACAKDRNDRFASCDEMIAALDEVARRLASPSPALKQPPPTAAASSFAVAPPTAAPATAVPTAAPTTPPVPPAAAKVGHGGAETTVDTTAPGSAPRRRFFGVTIAAVVALGAAAAGLVMFGGMPGLGKQRPRQGATSRDQAATHGVSASASAGAAAGPGEGAARSPLAALVGRWSSNGRELDAVMAGDALEFRVRQPEQFAPQDYEAGEARFVLRPIAGEPHVFAVEDRIRFFPPVGLSFDRARARGACQDVRTSAEGTPLRARFDGSRLSVEFARLEPTQNKNFVVEGGRVVSCVGIGALPAGRVVSTLARP